MSKEGSKITKLLGKKKINHYNIKDCDTELARLDNINDNSSVYRMQIVERRKAIAG